ncbi:MAG: hypothetical protein AAGG51_01490 [Cyanobacteria bacterium P01_G01_bin.54]
MKWLKLLGAMTLGLLFPIAAPTATPAQDRFDPQVVRFSEDTIVEFEIAQTQGANRAEFGVIANPDRGATKIPLLIESKPYDDFGLPGFSQYTGTVSGGTIAGVRGNGADVVAVNNQGSGSIIVEYLFEANVPYVFYMDIYTAAEDRYIRTLTSVNVENTRFNGALDDGRGLAIAWEDQGEGRVTAAGLETEASDGDFNDVVVFAGGELPCLKRTPGAPGPANSPGTLEAQE